MNQPSKLTPMLEQYLGFKDEHPDALLFYRMGDFYELFFEDAHIAARELQIALTCRNPNADVDAKVPMCGVPHQAVEGYLSQLLQKGYKIAVCDQIEDPKQAKGLVKRAVTRVLTPGTAVEDSSLSSKEHNYLAALFWDAARGAGGLAWLDYSTGDWSGLQSRKEPELWQWAVKVRPSELLLSMETDVPSPFGDLAGRVTRLPARPGFDLGPAERSILEAQHAPSLGVLDLDDKPELTRACGALLAYLRQTQKRDLGHLGEFRPLNLSRRLILDEVTERNLEIFRRLDGKTGPGTLLHVLDQTLTPMGGRVLAEMLRSPWREIGPIQETQAAVERLCADDALRGRLRGLLEGVYDVERLSTRIFLNRATPKDFVALRQSLSALPALDETLREAVSDGGPPLLAGLAKDWDDMADLRELFERALVDNPPPLLTEGGLFRAGYDAELDELLELSEHGEARMQDLLLQEQRESGLSKLKLGYNRVFGYYFELPKSQAEAAPAHFIRRQTLAGAERFVTPPLKELEEKLLSAGERRKNLEYTLFQNLREIGAAARSRFLVMARLLARLDYWQGLAEAARRWDWVKPALRSDLAIRVKAGRHPVVEAAQGQANYVPSDLAMDEERRLLLITGPNMAGKSTVIRQAAVMVVMAQIGSFVPAAEAEIGLCDRVFSRVGASDNLAQGQSTFMVEMTETARILRQAGKRSLVVLDEIGRGTSTFDGLSLAWAVLEDLSKRQGGVRTLFATHYHELTVLEGKIPGVRNMNIAVKEWRGDIVFLRRLVPGPSDRSYGIEVARLAGVPQPVVERAKEILRELEKKSRSLSGQGGPQSVVHARQTLLPGMGLLSGYELPAEENGPAHPLLEELGKLSLDALTPLDALTILHRWKAAYTDK